MAAFVQTFERRQTRRAYRHDLQNAFGRSRLRPSDLAAVSASLVISRVWGPENERNGERTPGSKKEPNSEAPSPAQRRQQAAVKGFLLWLREPPQQEALRDTKAAQTVRALTAYLQDDSA